MAVLLNYTTIIYGRWGVVDKKICMDRKVKKKTERGIVDMVSQWHVTRKNYLTFNNSGNKFDDCL